MFINLMLSMAMAQEVGSGEIPQFNSQSFRPAVDSLQYLWLNDTSLGKDKSVNFRTTMSYSDSPIIYFDYTGTRYELLKSVTQMDVSAGYTRGRARYALSAPVILYAPGDTVPGVESGSVAPVGLGEMMADVKYQILHRNHRKVGLAVTGRSSLPTSTMASSLGTDGIMFELETGLDTELQGITLAMNLGHRQQPPVQTESVEWGSQIYGRAGIAKPFDESHAQGLSVEYNYATLYSDMGADYATAQEIMFGGWFSLKKYYQFRAGISKGLSSGMTTPAWRGIVSVSFLNKPPPDRDADGIVDKHDTCPDEPEDFDGFQDEEGCPDPTTITVKIVSKDRKEGDLLPALQWKSADGQFSGTDGSTFMMQAGKIDLSVSHEDYKPAEITAKIIDQEKQEVQIEIELRKGSLKLVAQTETGEKIPEATWEIKGFMGEPNTAGELTPLRPGEYEIVVKAPNFRLETRNVTIKKDEAETMVLVLKPAKVKVTDVKLEILDKVYFKTGSYEIDQKSDLLLNEVADVLKHYPNILQVQIEGHTDSQGKAKYNKQLSQGRADEVKRYLVSKGIEPSRLTSMGFGGEKPIANNKTSEGRSMNRRVIFVITDSVPRSEFDIKNAAETEKKQDELQQKQQALDIIEKKDEEVMKNKEAKEKSAEQPEEQKTPSEEPVEAKDSE